MVDELTPEDVKARLDADEDIQVVDIRSPSAYEDGHVPGAVNVPMADLPGRVDDIDWGEEIVVVCPVGHSSIRAARLIESYEGIDGSDDVYSMRGGYETWDDELVSSSPKADPTE